MEEKMLRKLKRRVTVLTAWTALLSLLVLALAGALLYEGIVYNLALSQLEKGNIEKTEALLSYVPDYKDAEEILSSLEYRKVGNVIIFGAYEQDANNDNGFEPLEWIVLDYDAENEKSLVITKKCIEQIAYKEEYGKTTWANSDARRLLNGRLVDLIFSGEEKARVLTTTVHTSANVKYGTDGGEDTEDRIFLLSDREFNKYLAGTENAIGYVTDYAAKRGVISGPISGTSMCWLRTPGESLVYVSTATYKGELNSMGIYSYSASCGVRPAMWISVSEP